MRKIMLLGLFLLVAPACALAYPGATLTSTPDTVTVGNLDCGTNYEIRVREWRSGAWRDQNTYTKQTLACPTPTPTPTSTPTATPTPTPTSTPPPTGFPDASTTGVPSGTSLTTVSGDLTVSVDNAIVDAKNVTGCIVVNATGVTVKNSKAKCIGTAWNARARNPANPRLTIQDSEVDCGSAAGTTAISDMNITVLRVNVHGCENGFDADSDITIQDSYIHDLYNSAVGDPHTDGLQSAVGSRLLIDHNTFYGHDTGCAYPNSGSCNGTSAINVNNSAGGPTSTGTTISNNLLAGGAFTLYCPIPATSNFNVTGNHFSTVYSPKVGEYGPVSDCAGESWSGNVIHETGATVGP